MNAPAVLQFLDPAEIQFTGPRGPRGRDAAAAAVDSVAELHSLVSIFDAGKVVYLISWHSGLALGGGFFYYDATDTTSADDGGLTIVDLLGRRWKREIPGNRISATMFGAKGQYGVDDTAAVNTTFAALRGSSDVNTGMLRLHLDDEGLVFDCVGSINATLLSGQNRNCSIGRLAINSRAAGKIAFDLTGSQFYRIEQLTVHGDPLGRPAVGIFQGRIDSPSLPHPTADRGHIVEMEAYGEFTKAAYMNLAAETYRIDYLRTSNSYYNKNAATNIFAGASDVIANFCGMPTSDFQTIGLGDQSLSSISIGQHTAQRSPAYNYSVSVSKANPAVVTMSVPNMATAIASFGLANGATIHLTTVGDGTGTGNWGNRSGHIWTVQNLNAGAGTFELAGMDTTGVTDNLTVATVKNDTGPAVVFGHLGMYREENGYYTSFSTAKIRFDTRTGPDEDRNWIIDLAARHELGTPHLIEIIGDTALRIIRGLKIKTDNENSNISPILISGCSGAGRIRLVNFELELAHNSQSPLRLFTNPQFLEIFGGRGVTLLNSLSVTEEPDETQFSEATFDLIRPGVATRVRYLGDRLGTGTWNFQKSASGIVNVRLDCLDDGAAAGPRLDLRRISASPAVNDLLGELVFVGRDSAGNDTIYAIMRAAAKQVTDGSEDGQLDLLVPVAGALNTRIWSANRYGVQGGDSTQTLTTNVDFTLTALSSPIETFHTGTLTQDRSCALNVTGAFDGCRFKITRTGAGAFNLNVSDSVGGLLRALATGTWGQFIFDGTAGAWKLAAYGTL